MCTVAVELKFLDLAPLLLIRIELDVVMVAKFEVS